MNPYVTLLEEIEKTAEQLIDNQEERRKLKIFEVPDTLVEKIPEDEEKIKRLRFTIVGLSKRYDIKQTDLIKEIDFDFRRIKLLRLEDEKPLITHQQKEIEHAIADIKKSIIITIAGHMRLSNGYKFNFYPFTELEIYDFENIPQYLTWKFKDLSTFEIVSRMHHGLTKKDYEGAFLKANGRVILIKYS